MMDSDAGGFKWNKGRVFEEDKLEQSLKADERIENSTRTQKGRSLMGVNNEIKYDKSHMTYNQQGSIPV